VVTPVPWVRWPQTRHWLAATAPAAAVTIDAVQAFGGYGYVPDYPVEPMMCGAHPGRGPCRLAGAQTRQPLYVAVGPLPVSWPDKLINHPVSVQPKL
jgi:hypothetical protein